MRPLERGRGEREKEKAGKFGGSAIMTAIFLPEFEFELEKRAKRPSFCPQSPAPEFRNLPPIFQ